jgi:hypothetical protein
MGLLLKPTLLAHQALKTVAAVERIREIARREGVPIDRKKPVSRRLAGPPKRHYTFARCLGPLTGFRVWHGAIDTTNALICRVFCL